MGVCGSGAPAAKGNKREDGWFRGLRSDDTVNVRANSRDESKGEGNKRLEVTQREREVAALLSCCLNTPFTCQGSSSWRVCIRLLSHVKSHVCTN